MSGLGLDYGGSSSSASDSEEGNDSSEGQGDNDDEECSDEEEEAARQRRKRQRANAANEAAAAASRPAQIPGLGSVDDIFQGTDTSILRTSTDSTFVAPSLDVAADAAKAQQEAAARAQKLQQQTEAARAAKATAIPAGVKNLRDIPGAKDHKAVGSARDWKTKEKLKRDRGQGEKHSCHSP